ncbi:MAG: ABC-type transport auxiliary lipoprotein family protein [Gemmatimonadales bacterium]
MTRRGAIIVGGLLLGGCLGGPRPVERYRLVPAPVAHPAATAATTAESGASSLPTLTVEPYATSGIYADPQIVFRLGETTYGTYPNREWAVPLGTMLADATLEVMRAIPALRARVADERASSSSDLVWRGVVQQFEEVDRGNQVSAAVRLDAALVRVPGDSVIWQGTVGLEQPVPEATMGAIVDSLSSLTSGAIVQLLAGARGALTAHTLRLSRTR